MFVICSILVTLNMGGINFMNKQDVEGRVAKDDPKKTKYLADFSEGVKKFNNLAGKPEDYKKVLVDKTDCVKE